MESLPKFGHVSPMITFPYFAPENKRVPQKVTDTTKQQKHYKLLVQKNLISKQARNVCSACLEYMNNDKLLDDLTLQKHKKAMQQLK